MHRPGARPTSRAAEPNLDTFPTSSSTATRLNSVVRETGEWPSVSDTTGHVRELCCKQVRHTARYYPIPPLTSCKDCSLSIPTTCSSGEPVKYPDTDTAPSRGKLIFYLARGAPPRAFLSEAWCLSLFVCDCMFRCVGVASSSLFAVRCFGGMLVSER